MGHALSLHIVAPVFQTLPMVLQQHLGDVARVRVHSCVPSLKTLSTHDVLIIQVDSSAASEPEQLAPFLGRHEIWLVYTDGKVTARWLQASHWPDVKLVYCESLDREAGCRALATSLEQHFIGATPACITSLVLATDNNLNRVEYLVSTMFSHPWEVRRPADLASIAGQTRSSIKRLVQSLGFKRVEHFITYVRWVAREQLVVVKRIRPAIAEHLTGIGDRSNLRRQLQRVRASSPKLAKHCRRIATGVMISALLLTELGCRQKAEGQPAIEGDGGARTDTTIALPVTGDIVRRGDLVLSIRTTGQVRAERLVSLRGETQGTVQAVLVRPGQRVDSGAVLVRLDPRPFELAVREAESQLADATVRYRDILLGDDTTESSPAALDRRRNARLRAGLDGAQARLERAMLDREGATLQAPFPGTVDQVQAVVGQRLGSGDPIITLVDLGSLIIEASVLEHDLPLIRRGGTASVSLAVERERSLVGRVIAVLPLVDTTTRSGRALVRVRTADGILRPGMYADVELEATRLPNRVLVPASAVIERDGRPLVFRYQSGRAEWVYVAPGRSNGRETEILVDSVTGRPAVSPGDTVLIEGHLTLTHDAPVRLVSGGSLRRQS